jgi:nicotinate phosphoribosyltransferase
MQFPSNFAKRLKEIIDSFRALSLQKEEKDFLREKCYYLTPVYIDFLEGYKYDPNEITIKQEDGNLYINIEGYWYRTILWEVPLMATISELYFEMTGQTLFTEKQIHEINIQKALDLAFIDIYYSEFGTRRRYSYKNQDMAISDLKQFGQGHMLGSSNVHFAMKYDLIPMGTVAHEFFSAHAAMFGFQLANSTALDAWTNVYEGNLGTALPDTFTTDAFYRSFNTKFSKLFDGVRQDSGMPSVFTDKTVSHYKSLRINPLFKMAMYSDDLNSIKKIEDIHKYAKDKIIDRYGLGTWISNDVGVKPLKIVIKFTGAEFGHGWKHAIKLSDDKGKNTGDKRTIEICKETLDIKD